MEAVYKFFLFDFFQKLKKQVGIELDPNQYMLLLDCLLLKKNDNIESEKLKNEIRLLCKTLWLSRKKYEIEFDSLFEETWHSIEHYLGSKAVEKKDKIIDSISPIAGNDSSQPQPKITDDEVTPTQVTTPETDNSIKTAIPLPTTKLGSVAINLAEGIVENPNKTTENEAKYSIQFSLADSKTLPFNQRAIEHGWRKLKGRTIKITTDKLDIKGLIQYKSKHKIIDKLLFETEYRGYQHVIWLSDHGGSMAPFAQWDEELFQLMKKVPNTGIVERYYFHDCPIQKENDFLLFTDKIYTEPQFFSKIQKKCNRNTIFIIFSDGGAAHKKNDTDRVKVFYDFNNVLKRKTKRIVWFNPVLELSGTSAGIMQYFIKNYLPNNKGIKNGIANL